MLDVMPSHGLLALLQMPALNRQFALAEDTLAHMYLMDILHCNNTFIIRNFKALRSSWVLETFLSALNMPASGTSPYVLWCTLSISYSYNVLNKKCKKCKI